VLFKDSEDWEIARGFVDATSRSPQDLGISKQRNSRDIRISFTQSLHAVRGTLFAGNHKLKCQKESLIFHFRVPRGAEYRAKRRDCVPCPFPSPPPHYLGISIFALVFLRDSRERRRRKETRMPRPGNYCNAMLENYAHFLQQQQLRLSFSLSLSLSRQLNFHAPIGKIDYY